MADKRKGFLHATAFREFIETFFVFFVGAFVLFVLRYAIPFKGSSINF
jgi:hypothetical protein